MLPSGLFFLISDPTLGSIDGDGLYSATVGQSGTQTIIASIASGLTRTATVTQHIYLTGINIGVAPAELLVGNEYEIPVTYSPIGYTEDVNTSSTDSGVATLSEGGSLVIVGAGTATLSLSGASSGVTASITITATEEVIPETRLLIANNLSEIADNGEVAQAVARENLDLGELATKDVLTATDVGAVPQDKQTLNGEDLDSAVSPGRKFQSLTSNATTARHYPVPLAGMLDVIRTSETGIRQIYYPYNTTDSHHRYCEDSAAEIPVFSDWSANGAGNNLQAENNLSDVADAATARQNIGVSYTLSTDAAPADASGYAAGHIWYQTEES
ncbi:pyocin knob domain-containing protein [Trabulsiella odontotermitis]|uniref:pyocin knob domain-containing protein n=1 Tax=Trabulsiella odontotermitis TaxID=379893 RepID=UPI003ACE9302